jgi:membrane protein YdbS with pleckstrin-like domain
MTHTTAYGGRPQMPAPGVPTPELRVAQFRGHARRLLWSALVLIAVAFACGWFYDNLPHPIQNWMMFAAAGLVVFLLVLLPFLSWWSHIYTITTRRVVERWGILVPHRRELTHVRGYTIEEKRSILQRMFGSGTMTLSNGVDEPIRMFDVPSSALVHEALVDQVEVSQILAHRELPIPPAPPVPGQPA